MGKDLAAASGNRPGRLGGFAIPRIRARRQSVESLPPEIARILVDRFYSHRSNIIISAFVFMFLGVAGYLGSGSLWYLVGCGATAVIGAWRLLDIRTYARHRDTAPPDVWARRGCWSALTAAASWGAWSAVYLYEPNTAMVVMVGGAQGACVIGTAVRYCTVPTIARGQALLVQIPLFFAFLASGDIYYMLYTSCVVIHLLAAIGLTNLMHEQTLRLLLQDQEKTALLERLETTNQELEVVNQHLETLAATDGLTGVANRRAFDLAAAREWRRSAREQTELSMLLMDIDHFKKYNDFYGHQAGDGCLKQVAAAIGSVLLRPGDQVARYGGEEFVVILPNTGMEQAAYIGERILAELAALNLPHDASPFGTVTVSIGAACMIGKAETKVEDLIADADAALYVAKRGGRNQVRRAETTPDPDRPVEVILAGA